MADVWQHHEPHPVTGVCVWCHKNSTSSVGCTRGQTEEERLRDRIRALESELAELRKREEWIPVAERLPEGEEVVLICNAMMPKDLPHFGYRNAGRWVDYDGWEESPTHWRPLPASPRPDPEHRDDGGSKPQEQ